MKRRIYMDRMTHPLFCLLLFSLVPGWATAEAATRVSISDGRWLINGEPTNRSSSAEGLLMNVRMVNATFEDRSGKNPEFDAEANANEFIASIPDYAAHGVNAFTLCLQGGMPGYEGAVNSAFEPDGSLRAEYLERVARVIQACDERGLVVILGCYYQRQSKILRDDAAIRAGLINVTKWIQSKGFENVVLEVANEFPHRGFVHEIIRDAQGQAGLIRLVKKAMPALLVTSSGYGDGRVHPEVAEACDFLTPHWNGTKVEDIPARVAVLKQFGKPIVCNEDDKVGEQAVAAMSASVSSGAAYGLMLQDHNQTYPFHFNGAKDDVVFYTAMKEITSGKLASRVDDDLKRLHLERGIVAVIGLPQNDVGYVVDLCRSSDMTIYFQTSDAEQANEARKAADEANLLGKRLFVETGSLHSIHLGSNVADRVLVNAPESERPARKEILRALRPQGFAVVGRETFIKPVPEGVDDWSHPYHGPDNNPQSDDRLVHGSLRTQFIGFPKFSPMPEQTVVAGGRIYKAMGHIAHKANQNEMLNTLLCINAYNGTIIWKRPLSPGFMLHRNTMIATDDALYMGDHESCKIIDGETGNIRDEIKVDVAISDGPVWKWMAMRDGILYALVGNPEVEIETQRAIRRGLGHWPWGMWDGHDYNDPRTSFGFGRTIVAIDIKTKERIWHYRDKEFLDARAICMNDSQIFCYCPEKFLAAIDRSSGKLLWKSTDQELLDAIGSNERSQRYVTGYATTCYMKCTQDYLFFAGPQRNRMVVASAKNGKLAWTHPIGNLQLVLREDGVWAAGPQDSESGMKFDYETGNILATFPARRACTRATGCLDSIFYRANGGTVRVLTESAAAQHFDPMRPPCQDGVIVAGGHLYWGPWMCGCQLSLYGNIALSPVGDATADVERSASSRRNAGDVTSQVPPLATHAGDWTTYRGNNARTDVSTVAIPSEVQLQWTAQVCRDALPTAPVTAGGLVFIADRSGAVQAFDGDGKHLWKAYTAGPIYYPPAVANDRVYVGSADGRVTAFAAHEGKFLWSYRVAPEDYWIPVYDHLLSAWPVAGGVVVDGQTVYAAAGITHYDGTHVVALDAITGELKCTNSTSGTLEREVNNGISLQGDLTIVDGELRFLAGGVYETARYDLQTLECLNTPKSQVSSKYRTAFYPYYPEYGKYVSLDFQCSDGCQLSHDASYEGSQFVNLSRQPPLPSGAVRPVMEAARWVRRGGEPPNAIWQDGENRRFHGFVVTDSTLLATGHPDGKESDSFLVSINNSDGSDNWIQEIPASAVLGGMSIDHQGRVCVALENGQLLCFAPVK